MLVNKKETKRYLGYGKAQPNEAEAFMIDDCALLLENCITPRCVHLLLPILFLDEGLVSVGNMEIKSKALSRALLGCESVVLFAATLGAAADEGIRREGALSVARATVMQAAAASAIETFCDVKCNDIASALEVKGLYLRPRFSPGYGDFELAHQPELLHILAAHKIGISCTDSLMLVPTKSVTAVIGVSKTPCRQNKGCATCDKINCEFREAN